MAKTVRDVLARLQKSGGAITRKAVSDVFRAHLLATGSSSDAWNRTLDDLVGPAGQRAGAEKTQAVVGHLRAVADKILVRSRKALGSKMLTYDVHPLDVWGNAREGFDVNDVYPSRGSIEIPEHATEGEIFDALKAEGFIDRNVRRKSVSIEGETGDTLYIGHEPTSRPEYELRPRSRG